MGSNIPRTRSEVEKIVNNLGYELLDEYFTEEYKRHYRRVVIQDKFGYKYDLKLTNVENTNKGISIVYISNPFTLSNISLWLKINDKDFELCKDNVYVGRKNKLKFYHPFCGEYFYARWDSILRGTGCGVCEGMQIGKYNNLSYLRPDLIQEYLYSKKNKTPDELTIGSTESVYWRCSKCGHEWWASVQSRCISNHDCSKCMNEQKESKIAIKLKKYILEKYNATTEYKIIKNPKSKFWLPYDIYIYDNIFIEIHGLQHYILSGWHKSTAKRKGISAEEEFEYRKSLSLLKKNYAQTCGIYIEIDLRKIKTIEDAIQYVESFL